MLAADRCQRALRLEQTGGQMSVHGLPKPPQIAEILLSNGPMPYFVILKKPRSEGEMASGAKALGNALAVNALFP